MNAYNCANRIKFINLIKYCNLKNKSIKKLQNGMDARYDKAKLLIENLIFVDHLINKKNRGMRKFISLTADI